MIIKNDLNTEELFHQAEKFHKKNDILKAENLYKKIIEIDPQHIGSLNNLGIILIGKRKFKEAKNLFNKIIQINPSYSSSYNSLGIINKTQNNLNAAINYFKKAVEINSKDFYAFNNLGLIFRQKNENIKALEYFEKSISINPKFDQVYNNIGTLYYEFGKFDEAIKSFENALKINPYLTEVYCNLGLVYEQLGEPYKAFNYYDKVRKNDKNYLIARYNLGNLFLKDHQYEKAIKIFESIDFGKSKSFLLRCYFKLNYEKSFYKQLKKENLKGKTDAIIASLTSEANYKYKKNKSNSFCNKPLDHLYKNNLDKNYDFKNIFVNVYNEILDQKEFNNKQQKLLVNGLQSAGNIFLNKNKNIFKIKEIINREIKNYLFKYKNSDEGFIKNWKDDYKLNGWFVCMKNGGKIKPHIHDYGRLSGSIYINVPGEKVNNSGDLVVSLTSQDSNYNNKDLSRIINIETGTIFLFPASLFHYTIPFSSKEDRIVLAFDVI